MKEELFGSLHSDMVGIVSVAKAPLVSVVVGTGDD